MLKFLKKMFSNKTIKTPLGRWKLSKTFKEQQIKMTLANHDCCGGIKCETPHLLNKEIKNIIFNKTH